MNNWCLRLTLLCTIGSLLVVLTSWGIGLAGGSVANLLSENGLLWMLQRLPHTINTQGLLDLLLYLQAYGIAQSSGLLTGVFMLFHPHRVVTYAQRITLFFVGLLLGVIVLAIVYYSWYEDSPFRSLDNTFWGLPLMVGHSLIVACVVNLIAGLYGFMTERFTSFQAYTDTLCSGLRHYPGLLLLYIAGSILWHLVAYTFWSQP